MSRIVWYNDENRVTKEIIDRRDECRYKVNKRCYNNRSVKDLGKRCRKGKECEYYQEEREKIDE